MAVVAGLIGAFVELDRSSLWYDELFTAWVITADASLAHVMARIATDLHPPLYYLSTYAWSLLFGTGDAGLRSFSAVCAAAMIAVLFFALRPLLTLQGRLVVAALATGSRYWFYMAQNARSYALCLLLGAILLWLAVELLRDRGARPWPPVAWGVTAFAGAFSHFFMTFEGTALCLCLALYVPRRRMALLGLAGGLVIANALYLKLVIERFARFSVSHTWMSNSPGAYFGNVIEALKMLGLREIALLALLVWAGFGLWRLARLALSRQPVAEAWRGRLAAWRGAEPFTVICWSVPVLVFLFSLLSSLTVRANFTTQNFLNLRPVHLVRLRPALRPFRSRCGPARPRRGEGGRQPLHGLDCLCRGRPLRRAQRTVEGIGPGRAELRRLPRPGRAGVE